MDRKKTRRQSSRQLAFKVCPRICKPIEWRDNFKMRMTRMRRIILRTTIDLTLSERPAEMKKGSIAHKSIQFMTSRANFKRSGQVNARKKNSTVNHMVHVTSMMEIILYCGDSLSVNSGNVSRQKVVTESKMNTSEMNAMICEINYSKQNQYI